MSIESEQKMKRLRVTIVYEYDVDPKHYPNGNDPLAMAMLDLEADIGVILDGEWEVDRAVFREALNVGKEPS